MTNADRQNKSAAHAMPSSIAIKKVAPDARKFGESLKILFTWKSSIYQMLWKHVVLYYAIYVALSLLERFALSEDAREVFKKVAKRCAEHSSSINLAIMLGFFTSTAIQRLFTTLITMPGTYSTTAIFSMALKPNVPECRQMIATFARWQLLSWVLMFRVVCKPLRRIFPDLVSLQRAGLVLPAEKVLLEQEEASGNDAPKSLIVIEWTLMLLRECQEKKYYFYEPNVLKCVEVLMVYKKKCSNTIKFGLYNIPRALIQTVVIAVYSLGVMTILGRGLSKGGSGYGNDDDVLQVIADFFPLLPLLHFFVYLSWLTLGRAAVNPFGDDDSDFDIPKMIVDHIEDSKRLLALYDKKMPAVFQDASEHVTNCGRFSRQSTVLDVPDVNGYFQRLDSQETLTFKSLPEEERTITADL